MHFSLLNILWFITLVPAITIPLVLETESIHETPLAKRNIPRLRGITYYINVGTYQYIDPKTGIGYLRGHGAIELEGNEDDGPLRFEIASDGDNVWPRVLDLTTANTGKAVQERGLRKVVGPFDLTRITNKQILDPETGEGIVRSITERDPEFRNGPGNKDNLRTCHDYVLDFIKEMGVVQDEEYSIPKEMQDYIDNSKIASGRLGFEDDSLKITKIVHETASADRNKPNAERTFDLGSQSPQWDNPSRDSFVLDPHANYLETAPRNFPFSDEKSNLVRMNGELRTFTSVGKDALMALGVAGDVVGAVFVILDFVNHNWVGGAVGAVGVAAGIAAGLLVEGPLGWVIGGLIALFTILPGLFTHKHDAPPIANVTQILQWSFFGDKDHTGNEGCRKGTKDIPGNPDCQALYGAGTLVSTLKLDNFDSVAFLLNYNNGYPTTIPEIASHFYVANPKIKGDGDDKIATIKCNNRGWYPIPRTGGFEGDNLTLCNHPSYHINRDLFTLPNINQTASNVYNRIIPATNGDCKILAYPGDQFFPYYNLTISGLPSAIACGLNSAINESGIAVPIAGDNNGLPTSVVSNGSQSTNGENIGFVVPPPKTSFKALDPANYTCIAIGTDPPLCLPPGSYKSPSDAVINMGKVDTLTLPPGGWSLTVTYSTPAEPHFNGLLQTATFNTSLSPKQKNNGDFHMDMRAMHNNIRDKSMLTIAGPTDGPEPVCCLYKGTSYGGDALCVGVGGDDLPLNWQRQAQSISCLHGGWAWLYIKEYGDDGAALIQKEVLDLKDEPYGAAGGTFSKNVTAMWVLPGN